MHRARGEQARDGARAAVTPQSLSTSRLAPSLTACSASAQRSSRARSSAGPGSAASGIEQHGQHADREVVERSPVSFASSSLWSTGCASSSSRHCCGVSESRLPSPPRQLVRVITSFSRIGSMGGLVTCANCCLKYRKSGCGRSLSTASGRVVSHAADRLVARRGHRRQQEAQVFARVAGGPQARRRSSSGETRRRGRARDRRQVELVVLEPLRVGLVRRDLRLDLVVAHDAAARRGRRGACGPAAGGPSRRRPRPRSRARRARSPRRRSRSAVTTYFMGRRPLRSSVAPT